MLPIRHEKTLPVREDERVAVERRREPECIFNPDHNGLLIIHEISHLSSPNLTSTVDLTVLLCDNEKGRDRLPQIGMINLHYIRAAIEANTGVRLSLSRVRELLVEEGLITQKQADEDAALFTGYHEFFDSDWAYSTTGDVDTEMGLPDKILPGG